MLRSFKQAMYSVDNVGHFGLAADAYTHFTSPIRRYPDLVVHRILKSAIARKRSPYSSTGQLEAIADESSERERIADQAERELFEWKKMIFLEKHLGDEFEAIVISIRKDGYGIELIDQFIEGFIHATDLPKRQLRPGDRLRVQVARIDKLLRRAYFLPQLAGRKGSR
jgi:ribonuclease R